MLFTSSHSTPRRSIWSRARHGAHSVADKNGVLKPAASLLIWPQVNSSYHRKPLDKQPSSNCTVSNKINKLLIWVKTFSYFYEPYSGSRSSSATQKIRSSTIHRNESRSSRQDRANAVLHYPSGWPAFGSSRGESSPYSPCESFRRFDAWHSLGPSAVGEWLRAQRYTGKCYPESQRRARSYSYLAPKLRAFTSLSNCPGRVFNAYHWACYSLRF